MKQMMKELRILLADDQERIRYGLRALLRQQPGWKIIGEAENARHLLALATVLDPDLILVDWNLPDMKPDAVLLSLRKIRQTFLVIVISGQIEVKSKALEAGANAFASKTNSPNYLIEMIHSLVNASKKMDHPDQWSSFEDSCNRFETELKSLRQNHMIPGFTAAIVKDQNLAWVKGFGYVDLVNRIPAFPDTPYHLASLTKPFSAVILMQLVENGEISLDDPIFDYGIDLESPGCIRVKHLLNMTSEGKPGEAYHYNGDRYFLLAQVIENASGKTFQQLLIERILVPLNMRRTAPSQAGLWGIEEQAQHYLSIYSDLAKPYSLNLDFELIEGKYPEHFSTAAGLISTAEDLAIFDIAIDQNILISEDLKNKMFTPTMSNTGVELPYGLGWYSQKYQDDRFTWHWGHWNCVSSLILKVPDENISFMILANSENLSKPFDLGKGNVFRSPFAVAFYKIFVHQRR